MTDLNVSPRSYNELAMGIEDVVRDLLSKYPEWSEKEWWFNGEGWCGLEIPAVAWHLKSMLSLKIKGIILENPILLPIQWQSNL